MKTALAVLLSLLTLAWGPAARAISSDSVFYNNIQVMNNTSSVVTFVLNDKHCVYDAPVSFQVQPYQVFQFGVTYKAHDSNGDSCYSDDHKVSYVDLLDSLTVFAVQQTDTSNDNFCLSYTFFAFFYIDTAVCPRVYGNMITAQNASGPNASGFASYCPPNVPACPPLDDGDKTETFGFLYDPAAAMFGAAPPTTGTSAGNPIPAVAPLGLLALLAGVGGLGAWRLRRRR